MHLNEAFLDKYPDFPEEMTEYGMFVYYRTYSRWLPILNRRETWKETCTRSVLYNCSLAPTNKGEAEALFDNMFHLRQFLSGRTLWVGGTPVANKYPLANFNCAFVVLDDFEAIRDLFYLLMVGTGVGFRILKRDVDKLPPIRTDVKLIHEIYTPIEASDREDLTTTYFYDYAATIVVGDSKEGWVQALDQYFRIHWDTFYRDIKTIRIVYDHVRPKGERLKSFGGTASGHESLKTMFTKIHRVITTNRYAIKPIEGKLRPIHCLDICNIIGENVVVGGVRRTSQIALLDPDDVETLYAKKNLQPENYHRFMSNNSLFYESKPTREQLAKQFDVLKNEGEPCFVNAEAGRKRRPDFEGLNPCAEVLLSSRGTCNLTTVNVMGFVHDGALDVRSLLEAQRLSVRAGFRMTCVNLELYKWDVIQKRDRLLGCSLTGWQDAIEAAGLDKVAADRLKAELRQVAHSAASEYSVKLGVNLPLLITTVKPEGTLSQVAGGVSSGLHHAHAPYYVRRVRINANDPLCKVAEELGWPIYNEVGQGVEFRDDSGAPIITSVTTRVIEFPLKSPVARTKFDVSAVEQLETYYSFQDLYTDQNSSNTITVKDDEWSQVEQSVWDNWDNLVAVSFIKLKPDVYKLAPYEAITREEYENRKNAMQPFDSALLQKYETGDGEDLDTWNEGCEAGVCPIR